MFILVQIIDYTLQMSYRDAFRPYSRVCLIRQKKKQLYKSPKTQVSTAKEKFCKRISNYIKPAVQLQLQASLPEKRVGLKSISAVLHVTTQQGDLYRQNQIKFCENLPNSQKFRGQHKVVARKAVNDKLSGLSKISSI